MSDKPRNPDIEKIEKLLEKGNYAEALSEAKKLRELNSSHESMYEINDIIAWIYFNLKQYAEAEKEYIQLANKTNNPKDWFNLCTSSTLNKNIDVGENAFTKAVELYTKDSETKPSRIFMIRYYYMCALIEVDEYDNAFKQLNILRTTYYGISDLTYLVTAYGGQMVSLTTLLNQSISIFKHLGKEKSSEWLTELSSNVDSEAKSDINTFLNTL